MGRWWTVVLVINGIHLSMRPFFGHMEVLTNLLKTPTHYNSLVLLYLLLVRYDIFETDFEVWVVTYFRPLESTQHVLLMKLVSLIMATVRMLRLDIR